MKTNRIKTGTRINVLVHNIDGTTGHDPATIGRRTKEMGELPAGYYPVTFDRLYQGRRARLLVHETSFVLAGE